jgi:hypothetical protein
MEGDMRFSLTHLGLVGVLAAGFFSPQIAGAQTVALVTINQQALFF